MVAMRRHALRAGFIVDKSLASFGHRLRMHRDEPLLIEPDEAGLNAQTRLDRLSVCITDVHHVHFAARNTTPIAGIDHHRAM